MSQIIEGIQKVTVRYPVIVTLVSRLKYHSSTSHLLLCFFTAPCGAVFISLWAEEIGADIQYILPSQTVS